jgi:hypothetical protein
MVKATSKARKRSAGKRRITNLRVGGGSRHGSERQAESVAERSTDSAVNDKAFSWDFHPQFDISVEFPVQFSKLKQLLSKHQKSNVTDEDIKSSIGRIVYTAKSLYKDQKYRHNLVQCINNSSAAADIIGQLYHNMQILDPDYLEACLDMTMNTFSPYEDKMFRSLQPMNHKDRLAIMMYLAQYVLKGIGLSLSYLTQRPEKKRGRGQPPVPYVPETYRLMIEWESWTGKSAVTPKKMADLSHGEDQGHQASTEFVRLCLKMIDSEISAAEARTCITNAKKLEKRGDFLSGRPVAEYRGDLILNLGRDDDSEPALRTPDGF